MRLIDPTGREGEVTIETNKDRKKGTIKIKASIFVYSADGKMSKDQLEKKKDSLKAQIEKGLSGTFELGGVSYTVSANMTVNVVGGEKEAIGEATKYPGSGNIAGFVDASEILGLPGGKDFGTNDQDHVAHTWAYAGETFDRMIFAADASNFDLGVPPHEFGHGLGDPDDSRNPQALMFSAPSSGKLTNEDFQKIFGSAIDAHMAVQQQMQGQYPYARTQPTITTHNLRSAVIQER